ncbi:hypothetical protein [Ferrovibrio terrae]|uniref:hypothetical protein n=1 Tax=Ferrovibrio terrae TaxID=2594003 RepID=UPI003137E0A5
MKALNDPIRSILSRLPSEVRIRLGRGVVNNTTSALIGVAFAVAAIAWGLRDNPLLALGVSALLIGTYLFYLLGTWIFAERNPEQAMLGGSEFLQALQLKQSAKGVSEIPVLPPVEAPKIERIVEDVQK